MWKLVFFLESRVPPIASPRSSFPKDGGVRWVSDLQDLNKILKRRAYPLANIMDILTPRPGYSFFSKLDISMQYYTFALDKESANLCVINTPFGLFCYNRLPMGVTVAPGFAQQIMVSIFEDLPEVDVYLDDVGIFNNDWDSHLASLRLVLGLLEDNGFTVIPLKCEWGGVQETDWLGLWITPLASNPGPRRLLPFNVCKPLPILRSFAPFLGLLTTIVTCGLAAPILWLL